MLAARLSAEAPEGFVVAAEDIVFEGPIETEESDRGVRLEVRARADAVAELDDAERAALAAELAGASAEDAAAILARRPEIAEYTVDYHPAWFPSRCRTTRGGSSWRSPSDSGSRDRAGDGPRRRGAPRRGGYWRRAGLDLLATDDRAASRRRPGRATGSGDCKGVDRLVVGLPTGLSGREGHRRLSCASSRRRLGTRSDRRFRSFSGMNDYRPP